MKLPFRFNPPVIRSKWGRILLLLIVGALVASNRIFADGYYKFMEGALGGFLHSDFMMNVGGGLNKVLPFNMNNPVAYVKIIYIIQTMLLCYTFVWFWFQDKKLFRLALIIDSSWLIGGLLCNIVGKLVSVEEITSIARYTTDYLFSPLAVSFTVPVLTLAKQSGMGSLQPAPHEKQVKPKVEKN
jgi:hypothetical protein